MLPLPTVTVVGLLVPGVPPLTWHLKRPVSSRRASNVNVGKPSSLTDIFPLCTLVLSPGGSQVTLYGGALPPHTRLIISPYPYVSPPDAKVAATRMPNYSCIDMSPMLTTAYFVLQ